MIPAFSPFLAVRYLLTRPIMLLGIAGVTFAVWAILVVDAVFSGFVTEIRVDVARSAPDLLLTDLPHETGYEPLRAVLEADDGVAATAPRLRHHGLLQNRRAGDDAVRSAAVDFNEVTMDSGFALLLGIDPLREEKVTPLREWLARTGPVFDARIPPYWTAAERAPFRASTVLEEPSEARRARLLVPDEDEWNARRRAGMPHDVLADYRSNWPGVLVGWRRSTSLPLRSGDPVELLLVAFVPDGAGALKVDARNAPLAFAGFFATGHRLFDESQALLPIETLRTLLGHDISSETSIDLVTDVAIRLKPGLPPDAIDACRLRLQQKAQAVLPAGSAPCSVLGWEQQNSVFLGAVAQEHKMMHFVLFVVMLVAAFTIYATLHLMVVQKWKDIGILAAVGGAPRGIGTVFVVCGLVVGAIGALLGAVAGVLSARSLNDVNDWLALHFGVELFPKHLFDLPRIPVHLEGEQAVQVALAALLLAVFVALLPARKAARMNPVKALSYE